MRKEIPAKYRLPIHLFLAAQAILLPACARTDRPISIPSSEVDIVSPTEQSTSTPVPTETPKPKPAFEKGDRAEVVGTGKDGCLNVRKEPSTAPTVLIFDCLKERGIVNIKDGPVEADNQTWWRLEQYDGWAAEAYLKLFSKNTSNTTNGRPPVEPRTEDKAKNFAYLQLLDLIYYPKWTNPTGVTTSRNIGQIKTTDDRPVIPEDVIKGRWAPGALVFQVVSEYSFDHLARRAKVTETQLKNIDPKISTPIPQLTNADRANRKEWIGTIRMEFVARFRGLFSVLRLPDLLKPDLMKSDWPFSQWKDHNVSLNIALVNGNWQVESDPSILNNLMGKILDDPSYPLDRSRITEESFYPQLSNK